MCCAPAILIGVEMEYRVTNKDEVLRNYFKRVFIILGPRLVLELIQIGSQSYRSALSVYVTDVTKTLFYLSILRGYKYLHAKCNQKFT